jgi:hypothetical protein
MNLSRGKNYQIWAAGRTYATESLPVKCRVLSSNPSNTKNIIKVNQTKILELKNVRSKMKITLGALKVDFIKKMKE